MIMIVEGIETNYIVCEDVDEAIEVRDDLIDKGIYGTMPPGYKNWVIRISKESLSDADFKEMYKLFEELKN